MSLNVGNQKQSQDAAIRKVAEASAAIKIMAGHSGGGYITERSAKAARANAQALAARVAFPDYSLAEIAAKLGVTKDSYAAQLRRALIDAAALKARAGGR